MKWIILAFILAVLSSCASHNIENSSEYTVQTMQPGFHETNGMDEGADGADGDSGQ
jgi:hypothetical protein